MKKTIYNPQEQDGKKGFVSDNGEWLIQPLYDAVDVFREGVCWVKTGGKWGLINEKGETLIEPQFDDAREFNEGCGNVKLEGKWGVVDMAGNFIFKPEFDLICQYDHEIAIVKSGGKYGFINAGSGRLIAPVYDSVQPFSEGFTAVKVNGRWGFIDEAGNYLIEPKFYVAESFNKGKAWAVSDGILYEIDSQGNCHEVREMSLEECDAVDYSDDNLGALFDGFIDKSGDYVVKPKFERVDDFKDGFARVWIDGKEGIINTNGAYISEPTYVESVQVDDDCLDELLKTDSEIGFKNSPNFKNGYAVVYIGGKYGIINRKGDFVVQPIYLSIDEDVQDGYRIVQTASGKWSLMDEDFNLMFEPIKYSIHAIDGDMAIIAGYSGFVNCKNGEIIPPKFHHVRCFHDGLAAVTVSEASMESGDF